MSSPNAGSVIETLSHPHAGRRRTLKVVATLVSCAMVVTAATGWFVVNHFSAKVQRQDVFGTIPAAARPAAATGKSQNILILGSDTRDGLTKAQEKQLSTGKVQCNCTDTIMLVHFEADAEGATVVSFPRDLMVTVPSYTDRYGVHPAAVRQINTAYTLGGAPLIIRTIESLTNIRVDHYVQVKFSGVVNVVDALGGVDVCVRQAFSDTNTHLTLTKGTHKLNGIEALKYVRLRHVGDGSDLARIQRQQQFVVNALAGATSAGVLTNPFKLNHVLDATANSFVLDKQFSTGDLVSFANRLRAMNRSKLVLLTVPNEAYVPDPNRVQLQQPQADALFTKLRHNVAVKKSSVTKASLSTHARSGTSSACSAQT